MMTNGSLADLENEILRDRLAKIKAAAWTLIHLIEAEGEILNEAIDNLKKALK